MSSCGHCPPYGLRERREAAVGDASKMNGNLGTTLAPTKYSLGHCLSYGPILRCQKEWIMDHMHILHTVCEKGIRNIS